MNDSFFLQDFELGALQTSLAKERLLRYKISDRNIDLTSHEEGGFG